MSSDRRKHPDVYFGRIGADACNRLRRVAFELGASKADIVRVALSWMEESLSEIRSKGIGVSSVEDFERESCHCHSQANQPKTASDR